jgi:hypothetical protein
LRPAHPVNLSIGMQRHSRSTWMMISKHQTLHFCVNVCTVMCTNVYNVKQLMQSWVHNVHS